jgi:hypothetical protein
MGPCRNMWITFIIYVFSWTGYVTWCGIPCGPDRVKMAPLREGLETRSCPGQIWGRAKIQNRSLSQNGFSQNGYGFLSEILEQWELCVQQTYSQLLSSLGVGRGRGISTSFTNVWTRDPFFNKFQIVTIKWYLASLRKCWFFDTADNLWFWKQIIDPLCSLQFRFVNTNEYFQNIWKNTLPHRVGAWGGGGYFVFKYVANVYLFSK